MDYYENRAITETRLIRTPRVPVNYFPCYQIRCNRIVPSLVNKYTLKCTSVKGLDNRVIRL